MIRLAGQAARASAWLLHHCVQFVLAVFILFIVLIGTVALRLSQGPLEVGWIAHRLEAAATADGPTRLTIGRAELAWEGWRKGIDRPLDLRLTNIAAVDPNGAVLARLPRAELSVSVGGLFLGRILPRALEVDGARLRVFRAKDGTTSLDLGSLTDAAETAASKTPPPSSDATADSVAGPGGLSALLRDMTSPAQNDHDNARRSRWAQLRRVRIRDAAVVVVDHQLDAIWRAPQMDLDLRRRVQGGVEGEGHADLWIGGQTLGLSLVASMQGDAAATTTLQATMTPFVPAQFASVSPIFAPLSALDAKVSVSATASLDPHMLPTEAAVHVHIDAGHAHINDSSVPFLDADLEAHIGGGKVAARLSQLDMAPRPDGPRTRVTGAVVAYRDNDHYDMNIDVGLDQVSAADLPTLWPKGVGGPGTRPWITKNVTAGNVHDAKFAVALTIPTDLSDAELTAITGGFAGQDLTVSWLSPVPPVEHADARLAFAGPDTIDITLLSGRQAGGSQGGVMIRGGRVRLTGISAKHQFADIDADLAGPLVDVLTVLRHPRIKLLDRRPVQMDNPAGKLTGKLSVSHMPLEDKMTMDDLQIHAVTHLTDVHLGGIAAGKDLDNGTLDLEAGNDGLQVKGSADLAGIPSQLAVEMDFRNGPPSQVLTKVTVSGSANEKELARLGADPSDVVKGIVGVRASLQERRDGRGDVAVHLDLTRAAIVQSRLRLDKKAGATASGDVTITLEHDHLASIDRVMIVGDGIDVMGAADVAGGRPNVLRLQRVKVGATNDFEGEIGLPRKPGDAYRVNLSGASLDASGEFGDSTAKPKAKTTEPNATTPPYLVDLKFDRIIVANGFNLAGVSAHVDSDGRIIRRARIEGRTFGTSPFSIVVEPAGSGRTVSASAADMGMLLRALGVVDDIGGGTMSLVGTFDDRVTGHPLRGRLDVDRFRVHSAPIIGKILQGMTLYGLVDALSGPGLNFDRLVMPFRYIDETIELGEARAFSSSLGVTAKGAIDLNRQAMNIQGTVVPAYFFNSLVGRLPLVGRIFSPERGGGVFAMNYTVRGPFDTPSVGVNPLSALTPGFLRGVFSVFDQAAK
jgi:hypothetical protein